MRVESHRSSAGPFVLEGRVPGPELCSVPILPESAPLHSPRLPLESAQGLRGGVLWSSATSCVLPSAYLFSIPREFISSGFSLFLHTPRSQTAHRTIKNGSPEEPQSHPCIAVSCLQGLAGPPSFIPKGSKLSFSLTVKSFSSKESLSDSTELSELPGHTSAILFAQHLSHPVQSSFCRCFYRSILNFVVVCVETDLTL